MSNQLIEAQRYEIYLGLKRKWSLTKIAGEIGVATSTVCREVKRNSKPDGEYVWKQAQATCESRKHGLEGNHCKPPDLWWKIDCMILDNDWSPGQIAGVLCKENLHICKQTIYNHVHADKTGKLASHMPHQLKYNKKMKKQKPTIASNIKNRTSIHLRPPEADGTRFGDWEMDTIIDPDGNVILTLTERSTNFIMMEKLPFGRKALPLANAVIRLLFPYRDSIKTITTDNGPEFAQHLLISKKLSTTHNNIIVYFTDAYSAWQKGAIENANKLIRKYIPKHDSFHNFSNRTILSFQSKLNDRPRLKLHFFSPKYAFFLHFS